MRLIGLVESNQRVGKEGSHEAELAILVLAVALEVLSHGDSLLDEEVYKESADGKSGYADVYSQRSSGSSGARPVKITPSAKFMTKQRHICAEYAS